MTSIDSLNGINKVSDNVYEVVTTVDVGANIDNLENAIFIIKMTNVFNRGKLRFRDGCNTVFTRCKFLEMDDAGNYGTDNYNGSNARFVGANCRPVFKACTFITNDGVGRSDFDTDTVSAPSFIKDEYGSPCHMVFEGGASQFNHFASPNIIIDGLIIDDVRGGADLEFRIPPQNVNNLVIIDNNAGSNSRQFVVLMNLWQNNSTYDINKLSARNIACWQGNNTKTIRLIDPVGDIGKATNNNASQAGVLEIWRSYALRPFDVANNQFINGQVTVTKGTTLVDQQSTDNYKKAVFQHRQPAGSTSIQTDNNYRRSLCVWGFVYDVRNFAVAWDANNPDGVNDGSVIMKKDNAITSTFAQVSARNQCNSLAQVYEQIKYFEMTRSEKHLLGDVIAEAQGDTIKLTTPLTLLTGSNANPVQVNTGTTVYTSATLPTSQFKSIDATVNITSQADADKLKSLRIVGNGKLAVNMPANSTLELDNITFDSPLHIESTNTLTVVNKNGSNASVGSANVTIVALVNIQGFGIVSGSRVLIQYADGANETIHNSIATSNNITIEQQYTADRPIAVAVRKATGSPAYIPWGTTGTLTNNGFSFTANQVSDE